MSEKKPKINNEEIIKRLRGKYSQSFSAVVEVYQLDEKGRKLIVSGFKNIQEEIDSHKECALDRLLEKFLNPVKNDNIIFEDGIADTGSLDLVDLSNLSIKKEELCIKYGISPNSSIDQLFDAISAFCKKEADKIKGGKDDETN